MTKANRDSDWWLWASLAGVSAAFILVTLVGESDRQAMCAVAFELAETLRDSLYVVQSTVCEPGAP